MFRFKAGRLWQIPASLKIFQVQSKWTAGAKQWGAWSPAHNNVSSHSWSRKTAACIRILLLAGIDISIGKQAFHVRQGFCMWWYFQVQQSFACQEAYVCGRICRCKGVIVHAHMFQYHIVVAGARLNPWWWPSCRIVCVHCVAWFFYAYHRSFNAQCILGFLNTWHTMVW